jgi:hypothetical protein
MTVDPKNLREDGPPTIVVFGAGGLLALAAAIWAGLTYGAPGVVLVLVGTTLALVIAAFWTSVRMLIGEARLSGADAYAIGTQHTEEEQKRAVLRALKDLEFERSVGKISEDDYRQLVARYRWEAKRLLQVIDEKSKVQRQRAESVVQAHLAAAGLHVAPAAAAEGPAFTKLEEGAQASSEQRATDEQASEPQASEEPVLPSEDAPDAGSGSEGEATSGAGDAPSATTAAEDTSIEAPSEASSVSEEKRSE